MIIFKKLPDGTWEKSGAILPTETHYRVAVDAENPGNVYTAKKAVAKIEKLIAANLTGSHYRFELAMPPQRLIKTKPAKTKKKETGKQRRARLKAEGICTACGKRKASKGRCECKQCADYYAAWAKKAGK